MIVYYYSLRAQRNWFILDYNGELDTRLKVLPVKLYQCTVGVQINNSREPVTDICSVKLGLHHLQQSS